MDIISYNEGATANGRIDTLDSTVVKLTGNQTIEDVKTFISSPIVPTPTTDFQVATKKYVDDAVSQWIITAPTLSIQALTVNERSINTITIDDYDTNVTYIVTTQKGTIEGIYNDVIRYRAPSVTVDGTDTLSIYYKIGPLLSDTNVYNFNIINVPIAADDIIQVVDFTNEASFNNGFDII